MLRGPLQVDYQGTMLDFNTPFRRATMAQLVQDATGVDVLSYGSDVEGARAAALQVCTAGMVRSECLVLTRHMMPC